MPIRKPILTEIAAKTYLINEFGLDVMFLLKGRDRALVIDTGTGYFQLRETVEALLGGMPYEVALTHGHTDHAGGMGVFDRVWLHPADFELARQITPESRRRYGDMLKGVLGDPDVWAYSGDQVLESPVPELLPLEEGHRFELGGRTVETIATPGHTAGSVSFIDDASRILFSGDAANSNLLLAFRGAPVRTALEGLLKLKAQEGRFDRNYNGHIGYSGFVDCTAQPDGMLDDCIAALRGILDGSLPQVKGESRFSGTAAAVAFGHTRVTYDPDYLEAEA